MCRISKVGYIQGWFYYISLTSLCSHLLYEMSVTFLSFFKLHFNLLSFHLLFEINVVLCVILI